MRCMASIDENALTRTLGGEIAELRATAGISGHELARRTGYNQSTISRIEAGKTRPSSDVLAVILTNLGATPEDRERLLAMLGAAETTPWVATGAELPAQLTALIRFERSAESIFAVNPVLVPGLLQTYDYAMSVMRLGSLSEDRAEAFVTMRLGRQHILDSSLAYEAVIDETVLLRPMGSHDVMATQLRHLLEQCGRPNVTVRVLPISGGGHVALNNGFDLFQFAKGRRPIVHLEHLRAGLFVDQPDETEVFRSAADSLRAAAMSPADSQGLIADYMERHKRRDAA